MTRDQAMAILENIELIRHFAEGGEITHSGWKTNKILLSNMKSGQAMLYQIGRKAPLDTDKAECHRVA